MKSIIASFLLSLGAQTVSADEAILPYSAFGPQAAAYELIGMEWWQWDSHGDGTDREYPIKVVVFWNQTQRETAKNHPVDESKPQDFRYVEYSKAVEYLERIIREFKEAELDATSMKRALDQLKTKKQMATPRKPSD